MFESLFNPDNPVLSFINKVIDIVALSLVWALCCIPLVTIGAANSALYYAVVKSVRKQRGYALREFFRAFKINLKKGTIINIILFFLGAAMLLSDVPLMLTFMNTGKIQDTFLFVLFCIKLIVLFGVFCWIYPLLSRFDENLLKLGESSIYLLVRYFYITFPLIFVLAAAVFLVITEWLLIAVVPSIVALIFSFLEEPVLHKISDKEELCQETGSWFME